MTETDSDVTEKWSPYSNWKEIANSLTNGEVFEDCPPTFAAALRVLSAYVISDDWQSLISDEKRLDTELLSQTQMLLIKAGFREENVTHCIAYLIAAAIGHQSREMSGEWSNEGCSTIEVGKYLLAGYLGSPDPETINWVLGQEDGNDSRSSRELCELIQSSIKNDVEARRKLISTLIPFWKNFVDEKICLEGDYGHVGLADHLTETLGFPFKFASLLKDDAEFLAWLGYVHYNYGASGEEKLGRKLVAQAALLGSLEAWNHIEAWWAESDDDEMFDALIDTGREFSSQKS